MADPVVNSLVIQELDGATGLILDTLGALPANSMPIGGSLRSTRTYYPGSSTPSTQIMGTQEDDITLKGVWRDDQLGAAGGAINLYGICRTLLLDQLRCGLYWGPEITRKGYVKSFVGDFERPNVIHWTLVFQVDEADEAALLLVPFPPSATTTTLWAEILAVIAEIDAVSAIVEVGLAVTVAGGALLSEAVAA